MWSLSFSNLLTQTLLSFQFLIFLVQVGTAITKPASPPRPPITPKATVRSQPQLGKGLKEVPHLLKSTSDPGCWEVATMGVPGLSTSPHYSPDIMDFSPKVYCQISNVRHTKLPNWMFLVSSCSLSLPNLLKPEVLSREWRCGWISANRRCSNYIGVINDFIAY